MAALDHDESRDRASCAAVNVKRNFMALFKHSQEASRSSPYRPPLVSTEEDFDRLYQDDQQRGTILYLAYGSNLSIEKFRGDRGIRPLSQINVQVPALRLTFDLPGIPYKEPCFANSGRRDPDTDRPSSFINLSDESKSSQSKSAGYHKDNWHKGLIGVVYEVTPEDYAHIIATEGGGSGYQDILIECHPFATSDPEDAVPQTPTTRPFKAHTLFAPVSSRSRDSSEHGGRRSRHDPGYAQASARYLKLITDGAAELKLAYEYQDYLQSIRPFRITTTRQHVGQTLFTGFWIPVIMFLFALGRMFADKNGLQPIWLRQLSGAIFRAVWLSYDVMFRPVFGDGERSIPDGGHSVWHTNHIDYDHEKSMALTEDSVPIRNAHLEQASLQSLI